MISITLAIVIAVIVAVAAAVVAVAYCRHHSGKCQARIDGILSEKALEISEPMTMVIGPLSLLIKKEPAGTPNRRMLQIAMANAERVSSIMGLELGNKNVFKSRFQRGEVNPGENNSQQGPVGGLSSVDGNPSDIDELLEEFRETLDEADSFLERAQGVVNDHIDESAFDKDTFAIEMRVSPSTLYKKIKTLSGLTPTEYIKEIRLAKALSLIEETDLSISLISDMCGFSTVAYFGYSFRKRYGITPSEKRKEGKE